MGAVLRFPAAGGSRRAPEIPPFAVDVQDLDAEGAARMLSVVREVMNRARQLVEYLDSHRGVARDAGVETVVIELSAVMEGGKLQDVEDALEEASRGKGKPQITIDGFKKLRRAERLVLEAEENLAHFAPEPRGLILAGRPGMGCSSCGALGQQSWFAQIPPSVLILSLIGAGALIAGMVLILSRDRR
jgi:hypothetical protein